MSMKNSNGTIGTCSAVPQPTAPPRTPILSGDQAFYQEMNFHSLHLQWLTCWMTHLLVGLVTLTASGRRISFITVFVTYFCQVSCAWVQTFSARSTRASSGYIHIMNQVTSAYSRYLGKVHPVVHKYSTIFIYICRLNTTFFNNIIDGQRMVL